MLKNVKYLIAIVCVCIVWIGIAKLITRYLNPYD